LVNEKLLIRTAYVRPLLPDSEYEKARISFGDPAHTELIPIAMGRLLIGVYPDIILPTVHFPMAQVVILHEIGVVKGCIEVQLPVGMGGIEA
jgi:hypothetical protein